MISCRGGQLKVRVPKEFANYESDSDLSCYIEKNVASVSIEFRVI